MFIHCDGGIVDIAKDYSPKIFANVFKGKNFFFNKRNEIHTVWKLREITLTHFWQKFRESNGFTKEITK